MRSAERYLSQGKLRAAIGEYRQVVENDPRDFSTLKYLGDLHARNSEQAEAIRCFTKVAEHYGNQGFAQKAISIYNKILRLQPDTVEIMVKLADLHRVKGAIAEARTFYNAVAEQYQRHGRKLEALEVWKSIAELDPNNVEIYVKIADVFWQENQKDEAAKAYTEAGLRLAAQDRHEEAKNAFEKSLEVAPDEMITLNGMVKSQIALGYSDEAANTLEQVLAEQPENRDIRYLSG